jgi:SET domain
MFPKEESSSSFMEIGVSRQNTLVPIGLFLYCMFVKNPTLSRSLSLTWRSTGFQSRPKVFGLIPLREDHDAAEALCKQFSNMALNETMATDLWKIVDSVPWESRTSNALPHTYAKTTQAAKDGIRSLYQPAAQKPLEEIQAQGRCLDNIRHDQSTLPDAGRGAFATRNLYKGQVITGSPLLHIPNREFLTMYKIEPNPDNPRGRWVRNLYKKVGDQVLMNYCFGYWETTIFLCPYGVGVSYINHNQTNANVKIQWAKDGELSHNATFLEIDPVKLMYDYKVRLAFDYVATKDIAEGEELFLDYGDEWEAAWTEHVANWKPRRSDKHYAPADVWNKKLADAIIRTEAEQELDPYPSNILIRGHSLLRRKNYKAVFADRDKAWSINEKGYPCSVNARYLNDVNQIVYDVEIEVDDDENHDRFTLERYGIPRNALAFVDVPYSTDIHQSGVFRHELGIPLEMLTKAWLNR